MSWVVLRQPLRLPQGAAAARVLGTDGTADTVVPKLLVNSHQLIHHFRISQWFVLLSVRQNYVVFNESSARICTRQALSCLCSTYIHCYWRMFLTCKIILLTVVLLIINNYGKCPIHTFVEPVKHQLRI